MKTSSSYHRAASVFLAAIAFAALGGAALAQAPASAPQPAPARQSAAPSGLTVVAYQVPETTKFKVYLHNASGEKARIVLKNDRNEIVYAENVANTKAGYLRKFDLKDLPDGTYRLEVCSGPQKTTKQIGLHTTLARSAQVR